MVLPHRVELCVRAYKARPQYRRGQGADMVRLEGFEPSRLSGQRIFIPHYVTIAVK